MQTMETHIEELEIEHGTISKELGRFRPCDHERRCFYCRDWAQFVYKKHFMWRSVTQEDVQSNETHTIQAGKYTISYEEPSGETLTADNKARSTDFFKELEKKLDDSQDETDGMMIHNLIEYCRAWLQKPSSLSRLPDFFCPLEFNSFPDVIPLSDDPKDPAQLLDSVAIKRHTLCLPSEGFHLLKNLTGSLFMSHADPTCGHTRPECKSPAELEVDRKVLRSYLDGTLDGVMSSMAEALDEAWYLLTGFLDGLEALEQERLQLMCSGPSSRLHVFIQSQKVGVFSDYWSPFADEFKKKRRQTTVEEIDQAFYKYFDLLTEIAQQFLDEFAFPSLDAVAQLPQKLLSLVKPSGEYKKDVENTTVSGEESAGGGQTMMDALEVIKSSGAKAIEAAKKALHQKVAAFVDSLDDIKKLYAQDLRPDVAFRLDKINNHRDFKKRLKKVWSGYQSMCDTLPDILSKIFPDIMFGKCVLACLSPLLQEGEILEVLAIERTVKSCLESHQELLGRRQSLALYFEQGVQQGRRELAGILGMLFLKEGMRIQSDSITAKRQEALLKAIGGEEGTSTKKKKKKKGKASAPHTPQSGSVTGSEQGDQDTSKSEAAISPTLPNSMSSETKSSTELQPSPEKHRPHQQPPSSVKVLPKEQQKQQQPASVAKVPQKETLTKDQKIPLVKALPVKPLAKVQNIPPANGAPKAKPPALVKEVPKEKISRTKASKEPKLTPVSTPKEPAPVAVPVSVPPMSSIQPLPLETNGWGPTPEKTKATVDHWASSGNPAVKPNQSTLSGLGTPPSQIVTQHDKVKNTETPSHYQETALDKDHINRVDGRNTIGTETSSLVDLKGDPLKDNDSDSGSVRKDTKANGWPSDNHSPLDPPPGTLGEKQSSAPSFNSMNHEALVTAAYQLHNERDQLGDQLRRLQHEFQFLTSVTREREAQMMQLYEARKQTEMEEARRYTMRLETRVAELESQLAGRTPTTPGFAAHDLFGDLREMGQQRMSARGWPKASVVRCGNCGGAGHQSSACRAVCRYCSSIDHLSEACPRLV